MDSRISKRLLSAVAAGTALILMHLPTAAFAEGDCDFHMGVKDSFTLAGGWQAFTGIVDRGKLQVGDAIRITQPDGTSTVRRVDRIGSRGQDQESASQGDIVAIMLANADEDGLGDAVELHGHCGVAPAAAAEDDLRSEAESPRALLMR